MVRDYNGKQVKRIWFNGANGGTSIIAEGQQTLRFSVIYLDDHDEFWVEQYIDAEQVAIHNCKYIATIEWL